MTIKGALQPDQQPQLWDDHVSLYVDVFEPFTLELALKAINALGLKPGSRVIDIGAGAGGAALELACRGHKVTAIDASPAMIARAKERAKAEGLALDAFVMDGQELELPDASFDAGLSVFGIILFPDAMAGLAELRRVVRPKGPIALVTWTEPGAYELATELRAAAASVFGELPAGALPAQLRFEEFEAFHALFAEAGLDAITIESVTASFHTPAARWLADRIAFAPGMAAMLKGYGARQAAILEVFVDRLESRFGNGPMELGARVFIGTATAP
ncbi:MAG: methyltransferase domain-containing protein [Rhodomicrobium sp.]